MTGPPEGWDERAVQGEIENTALYEVLLVALGFVVGLIVCAAL